MKSDIRWLINEYLICCGIQIDIAADGKGSPDLNNRLRLSVNLNFWWYQRLLDYYDDHADHAGDDEDDSKDDDDDDESVSVGLLVDLAIWESILVKINLHTVDENLRYCK